MSEQVHIRTVVERDGEIHLVNLPVKRGQKIELHITPVQETAPSGLTAQQLLASDVIGLWQDREDINDSLDYARQLRTSAQHRGL